MTVWILARNDINFSLAAGLIRLHMPSVKESCVKQRPVRVTISTPITGTVYGRLHQLLLSKATSQLSFKFSDSL